MCSTEPWETGPRLTSAGMAHVDRWEIHFQMETRAKRTTVLTRSNYEENFSEIVEGHDVWLEVKPS